MEPLHIPEIHLCKADLVRTKTPYTGTLETISTVRETII